MKTSTLLENLNPEQLQAVTHTKEPLLIVAGAGTGKTTVITRRITWLIEEKLAKPDEILALTFTDKAAGEMEGRVDALLPLGSYDLWISTFHSFCERILKQHGLDIGLPNDFRLLDDVQQWIFVRKNLEKFRLNYYRPLGNPNKFIDALLSHFSKCKDELIAPQDYLAYAEKLKLSGGSAELFSSENSDEVSEVKRIEELAEAFHTYEKLMLDNEYLDFGDLINYTLELFKKRPSILAYYQKKFKFIMVDEFQDTNVAQYELVKLLASGENNLAVVGDDDQSIYKFRGASVSNILKLKEDYKNVRQITLIQNYRSSQNILDLAYTFIQANNPNRLESKLGIDKRLVANIKETGHIEVLEGRDLAEELNLVVKKILERKANDSEATWNDFAILVRANSAADEILPRLDSAGITYTFLASRGLFRKATVAALISYMRLLDNYHDSSALFRILNFPKFAIPAEQLAHLTTHADKKTVSLFEAMSEVRTIAGITEANVKKIESLISLMKQHAEAAKTRTAVEMVVAIIEDLGIRDSLADDTLQNAEQREFLEQFYKRIEAFEEQENDPSLKNFMATLELEIEAGSEGPIKFDPNLGPESLKVMTVHSAKGLEFKYVFIINMVDQRFPTRAKRDSIEIPEALIKDILPEGDFHLQEERRLFYVALTRAKTHLYLSWGRDYGGAKTKKPSAFLQETNLVPSEKVTTATGKVVFSKNGTAKQKVVYKKLPTTFSFTDISMFENCPLEYKYKKYLRLPMPGAAALSFGQTIHKVLELFAQAYRNAALNAQQSLFGDAAKSSGPDFKLLEQLYQEHWVDEWYATKKQKEEYRNEGVRMLREVYDDFTTRAPVVKLIEQKFKMKLGEYDFVGKIDRADVEDGGLVIIDYKTNGAPKIKGKRDVDQLRIYQWAAQDFLHEQVKLMYYWHLKDNKKKEDPLATPEELIKLQNSLLESIKDIRHTIQYDLFSEKHGSTKQHNCKFDDLL